MFPMINDSSNQPIKKNSLLFLINGVEKCCFATKRGPFISLSLLAEREREKKQSCTTDYIYLHGWLLDIFGYTAQCFCSKSIRVTFSKINRRENCVRVK